MTFPLIIPMLLTLAICDLPSDLIHTNYLGQWTSPKIFESFQVDSGTIELSLHYQSELLSQRQPDLLELLVLNPIYKDAVCARVVIPLGGFVGDGWGGVTEHGEVEMLEKQELKVKSICRVEYEVRVLNQEEVKEAKGMRFSVNVTGVSSGENCRFSLFSPQLQYKDLSIQSISYCLFISLLGMLSIASLLNLLKGPSQNFDKTSLFTLCFCLVQDLYLAMIHFYLMTVDSDYYVYFVLPIMSYVVMACLEVNLIREVFRRRCRENQPVSVRRKALSLTLCLLVMQAVYLCIMYLFPFYPLCTLLQSLFLLLPQIHLNSKTKRRIPTPSTFLTPLLLRSLLPLYLRGCPSNLFQLSPSFGFSTLWLSSFVFQTLVVYLQGRLGGRFFVLKCCLFVLGQGGDGEEEEGYRVMDEEVVDRDCCICLEELRKGVNREEESIKAPCGHMFHLECLRAWIQVKAMCPTCRAKLPELDL